jgi:hypothetical protein
VKNPKYFLFVLFAAVFLVGTLNALHNPFQVGSYQDDGLYINLGSALASGSGYVDIAFQNPTPHTTVPPVYPLLLALPLKIFHFDELIDSNFLALRLLSLVLMTVTAWVVYRFYQLRAQAWVFPLLVLFVINPYFLGFSNQVMSEVPYILFTTSAIYCLVLWTKKDADPGLLILAVLFAILGGMTRVIGIALIGAFAVYFVKTFEARKSIPLIVLLSAPSIVWFARNAIVGAGLAGGYSSSFQIGSLSQMLTISLHNLSALSVDLIPGSIIPYLRSPQVQSVMEELHLGFIIAIGSVLVTLVILSGWIAAWVKSPRTRFIELYTLFYGCILLITSFLVDGGPRYIVPVLPFLGLYLFLGVQAIVSWFARWSNKLDPNLIFRWAVIGLLALFAIKNVQNFFFQKPNPIPNITLGTTWIRKNTLETSIVMAERERDVYLYSRRKIQQIPANIPSSAQMLDYLRCSSVDYILVQPELMVGTPFHWDAYTQKIIVPAINSDPETFSLIFRGDDNLTQIYSVKKNGITCQPEENPS